MNYILTPEDEEEDDVVATSPSHAPSGGTSPNKKRKGKTKPTPNEDGRYTLPPETDEDFEAETGISEGGQKEGSLVAPQKEEDDGWFSRGADWMGETLKQTGHQLASAGQGYVAGLAQEHKIDPAKSNYQRQRARNAAIKAEEHAQGLTQAQQLTAGGFMTAPLIAATFLSRNPAILSAYLGGEMKKGSTFAEHAKTKEEAFDIGRAEEAVGMDYIAEMAINLVQGKSKLVKEMMGGAAMGAVDAQTTAYAEDREVREGETGVGMLMGAGMVPVIKGSAVAGKGLVDVVDKGVEKAYEVSPKIIEGVRQLPETVNYESIRDAANSISVQPTEAGRKAYQTTANFVRKVFGDEGAKKNLQDDHRAFTDMNTHYNDKIASVSEELRRPDLDPETRKNLVQARDEAVQAKVAMDVKYGQSKAIVDVLAKAPDGILTKDMLNTKIIRPDGSEGIVADYFKKATLKKMEKDADRVNSASPGILMPEGNVSKSKVKHPRYEFLSKAEGEARAIFNKLTTDVEMRITDLEGKRERGEPVPDGVISDLKEYNKLVTKLKASANREGTVNNDDRDSMISQSLQLEQLTQRLGPYISDLAVDTNGNKINYFSEASKVPLIRGLARAGRVAGKDILTPSEERAAAKKSVVTSPSTYLSFGAAPILRGAANLMGRYTAGRTVKAGNKILEDIRAINSGEGISDPTAPKPASDGPGSGPIDPIEPVSPAGAEQAEMTQSLQEGDLSATADLSQEGLEDSGITTTPRPTPDQGIITPPTPPTPPAPSGPADGGTVVTPDAEPRPTPDMAPKIEPYSEPSEALKSAETIQLEADLEEAKAEVANLQKVIRNFDEGKAEPKPMVGPKRPVINPDADTSPTEPIMFELKEDLADAKAEVKELRTKLEESKLKSEASLTPAAPEFSPTSPKAEEPVLPKSEEQLEVDELNRTVDEEQMFREEADRLEEEGATTAEVAQAKEGELTAGSPLPADKIVPDVKLPDDLHPASKVEIEEKVLEIRPTAEEEAAIKAAKDNASMIFAKQSGIPTKDLSENEVNQAKDAVAELAIAAESLMDRRQAAADALVAMARKPKAGTPEEQALADTVADDIISDADIANNKQGMADTIKDDLDTETPDDIKGIKAETIRDEAERIVENQDVMAATIQDDINNDPTAFSTRPTDRTPVDPVEADAVEVSDSPSADDAPTTPKTSADSFTKKPTPVKKDEEEAIEERVEDIQEELVEEGVIEAPESDSKADKEKTGPMPTRKPKQPQNEPEEAPVEAVEEVADIKEEEVITPKSDPIPVTKPEVKSDEPTPEPEPAPEPEKLSPLESTARQYQQEADQAAKVKTARKEEEKKAETARRKALEKESSNAVDDILGDENGEGSVPVGAAPTPREVALEKAQVKRDVAKVMAEADHREAEALIELAIEANGKYTDEVIDKAWRAARAQGVNPEQLKRADIKTLFKEANAIITERTREKLATDKQKAADKKHTELLSSKESDRVQKAQIAKDKADAFAKEQEDNRKNAKEVAEKNLKAKEEAAKKKAQEAADNAKTKADAIIKAGEERAKAILKAGADKVEAAKIRKAATKEAAEIVAQGKVDAAKIKEDATNTRLAEKKAQEAVDLEAAEADKAAQEAADKQLRAVQQVWIEGLPDSYGIKDPELLKQLDHAIGQYTLDKTKPLTPDQEGGAIKKVEDIIFKYKEDLEEVVPDLESAAQSSKATGDTKTESSVNSMLDEVNTKLAGLEAAVTKSEERQKELAKEIVDQQNLSKKQAKELRDQIDQQVSSDRDLSNLEALDEQRKAYEAHLVDDLKVDPDDAAILSNRKFIGRLEPFEDTNKVLEEGRADAKKYNKELDKQDVDGTREAVKEIKKYIDEVLADHTKTFEEKLAQITAITDKLAEKIKTVKPKGRAKAKATAKAASKKVKGMADDPEATDQEMKAAEATAVILDHMATVAQRKIDYKDYPHLWISTDMKKSISKALGFHENSSQFQGFYMQLREAAFGNTSGTTRDAYVIFPETEIAKFMDRLGRNESIDDDLKSQMQKNSEESLELQRRATEAQEEGAEAMKRAAEILAGKSPSSPKPKKSSKVNPDQTEMDFGDSDLNDIVSEVKTTKSGLDSDGDDPDGPDDTPPSGGPSVPKGSPSSDIDGSPASETSPSEGESAPTGDKLAKARLESERIDKELGESFDDTSKMVNGESVRSQTMHDSYGPRSEAFWAHGSPSVVQHKDGSWEVVHSDESFESIPFESEKAAKQYLVDQLNKWTNTPLDERLSFLTHKDRALREENDIWSMGEMEVKYKGDPYGSGETLMYLEKWGVQDRGTRNEYGGYDDGQHGYEGAGWYITTSDLPLGPYASKKKALDAVEDIFELTNAPKSVEPESTGTGTERKGALSDAEPEVEAEVAPKPTPEPEVEAETSSEEFEIQPGSIENVEFILEKIKDNTSVTEGTYKTLHNMVDKLQPELDLAKLADAVYDGEPGMGLMIDSVKMGEFFDQVSLLSKKPKSAPEETVLVPRKWSNSKLGKKRLDKYFDEYQQEEYGLTKDTDIQAAGPDTFIVKGKNGYYLMIEEGDQNYNEAYSWKNAKGQMSSYDSVPKSEVQEEAPRPGKRHDTYEQKMDIATEPHKEWSLADQASFHGVGKHGIYNSKIKPIYQKVDDYVEAKEIKSSAIYIHQDRFHRLANELMDFVGSGKRITASEYNHTLKELNKEIEMWEKTFELIDSGKVDSKLNATPGNPEIKTIMAKDDFDMSMIYKDQIPYLSPGQQEWYQGKINLANRKQIGASPAEREKAMAEALDNPENTALFRVYEDYELRLAEAVDGRVDGMDSLGNQLPPMLESVGDYFVNNLSARASLKHLKGDPTFEKNIRQLVKETFVKGRDLKVKEVEAIFGRGKNTPQIKELISYGVLNKEGILKQANKVGKENGFHPKNETGLIRDKLLSTVKEKKRNTVKMDAHLEELSEIINKEVGDVESEYFLKNAKSGNVSNINKAMDIADKAVGRVEDTSPAEEVKKPVRKKRRPKKKKETDLNKMSNSQLSSLLQKEGVTLNNATSFGGGNRDHANWHFEWTGNVPFGEGDGYQAMQVDQHHVSGKIDGKRAAEKEAKRVGYIKMLEQIAEKKAAEAEKETSTPPPIKGALNEVTSDTPMTADQKNRWLQGLVKDPSFDVVSNLDFLQKETIGASHADKAVLEKAFNKIANLIEEVDPIDSRVFSQKARSRYEHEIKEAFDLAATHLKDK